MSTPSTELSDFLDALTQASLPGGRVPTVRELMRRFGVSQATVQLALSALKTRGLIDSQVGRGTFFKSDVEPVVTTSEEAPFRARSVLLLRRAISIARGRVVLDGLQRRFTADGHRVLEVSYTDPDHARTVLKGLPRFDACMIQSSFKTITVDVLAALREKTDALVVDGAALAGTDVDAVGMEWGEPLATAIALLQQRGHTRIAYATTSQPFLANQLGQQRFNHLKKTLTDVELHAITVPHLPDENYAEGLVDMIRASLDASGQPPFTALVAWGIEDGARFRRLLSDMGLSIPSALSMVLLGRTDLVNEHADFFDTIGCSAADQIDYLHQAIIARWADPSLPYGVRLIPVTSRVGKSTKSITK